MTHLSKNFSIETLRFKLTIIGNDDLEDVFKTMNNYETANIISFLKWPITKEQAAKWCERSVNGFDKQRELLFIARDKLNSSPVGCISLHISDEHTGEIGYWVSESWQGLGSATEMLQNIISFAAQTCELLKLTATAAFENYASLKVLEKQCFQIIGTKDLKTAKGTILPCHLLELKLIKA